MSDMRWALLRACEDGNPLKWLAEAEMRELLADPSNWSIETFKHVDDMYDTDPVYWPKGVGVLLRIEVVEPERGGWRLPGDAAPAPAANTAWRHGDLVHGSVGDGALGQPIDLSSVHDSTRQVG